MSLFYKTITETTLGYSGSIFCNDIIHFICLPHRSLESLEGELDRMAYNAVLKRDRRFEKKVQRYFEGEEVNFSEPVAKRDISDFAALIYKKLRKIKWGQTTSYGDLAKMAQKPGAARAVGSIMSKNNTPLIIPCHRVIRGDMGLGGFTAGGGISMKIKMLQLEGNGNPAWPRAKIY